jgi:coenzyme F420-reducing hydrogenase alpha subunit
MAAEYPDQVRRGVRLQKLGNELIKLFGGRSVNPIGIRLGGFHRVPDAGRIKPLLTQLRDALPQAEELVRWASRLPIPEDDQTFTSVALRDADEYAICHGHIVSDQGLDIPIEHYADHFEEFHRPHSTALFSELHGQPYLVGPLARLNLNLDKLPEPVANTLRETGIAFPSRNMFHSIVARSVEIQLAIYEAIQLLPAFPECHKTAPPASSVVGAGIGCCEAPRGLLWHGYKLDDNGLVSSARFVPPTSQNQARIEQDLHDTLTGFGLHNSDQALRLRSEMVIRNYDPCISCSTHFLKLAVQRG